MECLNLDIEKSILIYSKLTFLFILFLEINETNNFKSIEWEAENGYL